MNDGTIAPIYGRVRIQSNTLPEKCQKALIDVYKPAIQRRIIKANKQIKATLEHFQIQDGRGLLVIVNDGNYALEADAALYLINRILGENFRQINSVIYFTANMFACSTITQKPALIWVNANREGIPCIEQELIMNLFHGWRAYLADLRDEPIEEILINDLSLLEKIRYNRTI